MKQIILISRIHPYGDQEEFSKYSDGDTPIVKETDHFKLLLIKGSTLANLVDSDQKAQAILATATASSLDAEEETLIAYHFRNELDKPIRIAFQKDGWSEIDIKRYGTASDETKQPIYQILNPLGEAIRSEEQPAQAQLIERLWRFISHDATLEAKLLLLQAILRSEAVLSIILAIVADSDSEKAERIAEATFEAEPVPKGTVEIINDVLEDLIRHSASFGKLETTDMFSSEYRHAFESLRDALGID